MVATKTSSGTQCKLLVGGEWIASTATEYQEVFNPSTGEVIAKTPMGGKADMDKAVQAAQKAFLEWKEVPVVERARVMFKFKALLEEHYDEIARCVTREHGKTFAEARASLQRGIEVVEFACGIPSLMMGESMENIARNVDCETIRHPIGVCAGISPFNFPAMVPLWMYPIAITCGNSFILKPSEKVPLTAMMIGDLLSKAGLPAGVFNIVHGGKDCVDAIIEHPGIRAISFVGSTHIAKYIYQNGTAHGKRVQAAGGAKNHIIIMPDADIEQTVQALQASAFGCAGERCMAGSLAIPVGEAAEELIPQLVASSERMKIGPTDGDGSPDMGPLVTKEHLDKVKGLIAKGSSEGAKLALDGREIQAAKEGKGFFLGPTIFDHAKTDMSIVKEEIFGPVLSVVRVKTLEDAINVGKDCPYGNGAVIYTNSGRSAREFKRHFNAGMIGVNVGVPAPMAWFPFTGWNNSFFGDLHIQGSEGIQFYTQQKMTMTRWFEPKADKFQDPIWKPKN
ncbi:MAG: CoA-acylating methylmalonate-semialdehyde dehydrogenase [Candidatus Obscuribacter sp.]|jgi:malonate-semialdehyde dehydrogenase (acetylating)/methylmalonate-semialdehyde dehydrogenase|nr:CoA-acylating methylmalonate-semialdehyde dehydrogenase [Candidatus Obscuribacter sp.]MDQ5968383.1 malonate-semialdehyde dehydrogenase (acetylating) / methylmalonate-semialdehyde dehydrogenase [Cyanobacteriota bacterium erpe_2018_sw_39hr_WHONDRS-SW48-000098_B_bin.30]MBK7837282.1 CoA-acylating methylmalonate-semialdehyde dehydrogenase [Candidatus Obscuribacter sp.]MBK9620142.1 CoA-acylating methylmalonate-semialdehyde dehydrogenase [Candidatus Obscuribacter sp.]MBK9774276.1 CoA-acylating meth